MTLLFPDFRSSTVTHVQAGLLRRLALKDNTPLPWKAQLELFALGQGFSTLSTDGGSLAVRPPFELFAQQSAGNVLLELRLPMTPDSLSGLLQNPTTLSTQAFVAMLPVPGFTTPVESPLFYFEITYVETSVTGDVLLQRLLSGLQERGFQASEVGPLPETLQTTLVREHSGSKIHVSKNGRNVALRYEQRVPRP